MNFHLIGNDSGFAVNFSNSNPSEELLHSPDFKALYTHYIQVLKISNQVNVSMIETSLHEVHFQQRSLHHFRNMSRAKLAKRAIIQWKT